MNERVFSFPPLLAEHPCILILGTMPGVASLQAGEYYAHPANAFWRILSTLRGAECPMDYENKIRLIRQSNLALWDVCHTCIRPGSADSDIKGEEPNAIGELLAANPSIQRILFNGKTAEKLFHRQLKGLTGIHTLTMPSTSPAHTLSFEKKLEAWRTGLQV